VLTEALVQMFELRGRFMKKVISPIAIDLGAKYTGLFLSHYAEGEKLSVSHNEAHTIVIPKEGPKMSWSQVARTATHHRIGGSKRKELAKRLLKLCVENLIKTNDVTLTEIELKKLWECLYGLLNRRGYNRLTAEFDEASLDLCEPYWFSENLPSLFQVGIPLSEQWRLIIQSPTVLRELLDNQNFSVKKNELKKTIKQTGIDKFEIESIVEAISAMKIAASNLIQELDFGHKHRKDYLTAIKKDIQKDTRLTKIVDVCGIEGLWSLIGNISNLQLRCLRWYFNDSEMKQHDLWIPQGLLSSLTRWFEFWRPYTEDERTNKNQAIHLLGNETDALKFLTSFDPIKSIPPYEDQDNRSPPKDQTLWLDPEALTRHYGKKWLVWAQKLERCNPELTEGIDEIINQTDRKSRLPKEIKGIVTASPVLNGEIKSTYFLQRLFDRVFKNDQYKLRYVAKLKSLDSADRLVLDLGSQHVDQFLDLLSRYYDEVLLAKQGLWRPNDQCVLERANINPPHKSKILNQLFGALIGERLSAEDLNDFIQKQWTQKVVGRSTLKGACGAIEKTRKSHGNLFNEKLKRLIFRVESQGLAPKEMSKDEKDIWSAWEKTLSAASAISNYFGHAENVKAKYSNPFSLSQMFNLLETDRRGFSKTTLAAHMENSWRMVQEKTDDGFSARCSRLAADSVRPFDGILRRILERKAFEIAKLKVRQIKALNIDVDELVIPILIEENQFSFSLGLADVKGKDADAKGKIKKLLQTQVTEWQSKDSRIMSSSQNICPYSGNIIDSNGEIDHILPRSLSLKKSGTVFNSEPNLIWCSQKGNLQKGIQRYTLADLNSKYLETQFGTSSAKEVEEIICGVIEKIPSQFVFDCLQVYQQRAIRHALFLDVSNPYFQRIVSFLGSQMTTRVNGTQRWFTRQIIEKIEFELADWSRENNVTIKYKAIRIDSYAVHLVRNQLGAAHSKFRKQTPQGVASHAIDAASVFAVAAASPDLMAVLGQGNGISEDVDSLASVIPDNVKMTWIERKPMYRKTEVASRKLFKDGIHAEHFLPLWVSSSAVSVGFDPVKWPTGAEDCSPIPVIGKDPTQLVRTLAPFLENVDIDKAISSTRPILLKINNYKAIEHLEKVATQICADKELEQADALDALHYTTLKKDVWARIYDLSKNTFKSQSEVLKRKDFLVKVGLNGPGKGKEPTYKIKGDLVLPCENTWKQFIESELVGYLIGTKPSTPVDQRKICEKFFNPGSKSKHSRSRRVFSLPVLSRPAGGYRIKRKLPTGNFNWQLQVPEDTPSEGFSFENNTINWKRTVAMPAFKARAGLFSVGERYSTPCNRVIGFDQWIEIKNPDGLPSSVVIEIAPGTKGRRYISVRQPLYLFIDWVGDSDQSRDHFFSSLTSELKVDGAKFAAVHGIKLLGKPRSNLFIKEVSSQFISYWYIVDSSNADMNKAYGEGLIKGV
jgi:CRISPR system subtype II-B RNA-guided endonuclease Cas9/Csx12